MAGETVWPAVLVPVMHESFSAGQAQRWHASENVHGLRDVTSIEGTYDKPPISVEGRR